MFKFLSSKLRSFRRDEEGVTLVEYGIALVIAVTIGTVSLFALADNVAANFTDAADMLDNPNAP